MAVEHHGGRAGAVERGGDLGGDVLGFANADDDDFSALGESFTQGLNGLGKLRANAVG